MLNVAKYFNHRIRHYILLDIKSELKMHETTISLCANSPFGFSSESYNQILSLKVNKKNLKVYFKEKKYYAVHSHI